MGGSGSQGGVALPRDPRGLILLTSMAGFRDQPSKGSLNQLLLASKTPFDTVLAIAKAGEFR